MKRFQPRLRFQGKVIAVMMAAICVVQVATLAAVQVVTERSVRDQLGAQLQRSGRLWQHFHEGRDSQLLDSVAVLADDFGFKAAVASNDLATMRSALANQGSRIGADFGVLLDDRGEVSATLVPGQPEAQAVALAPLFEVARREGSATGTLALGDDAFAVEPSPAVGGAGTLYRVALVPVLAPIPIAWVAMGTQVDAAYANEFSALTGLEASFVGLDGSGMRVFASSLPPASRAALEAVAGTAMGIDQVQRLELGGAVYYAIAEPVPCARRRPARGPAAGFARPGARAVRTDPPADPAADRPGHVARAGRGDVARAQRHPALVQPGARRQPRGAGRLLHPAGRARHR